MAKKTSTLITIILCVITSFLHSNVSHGFVVASNIITPGVTIQQDVVDGTGVTTFYCTLGWVGVLPDGTHIGVTAGHCMKNKDTPVYAMDDSVQGGVRKIGLWWLWSSPNQAFNDGFETDLGLFKFYPDVKVDGKINGELRATHELPQGNDHYIHLLNPQAQICKYGSTTYDTCGKWGWDKGHSTKIWVTGKGFANHGDSGGPVWINDPVYGVTAIGVINTEIDNGTRFTVEIMEPFLDKHQVKLLTS